MAQSIPITGIASDFRVPGMYAEVLFAQGRSIAPAGARYVLITGPILASGASYTVNTVYPVRNEGEVIAGAGAGSPLHRAVRAFLKKNQQARVFVLPYAATSGGSPVAAAGTITFTGSPTAAGSVEVDVCGEQMTVSFKLSNNVTDIATAVVGAINAKTWLPCTASNSSGVVTLTAKVAGASQGTASLGVIRFRAFLATGAGITVATSGAALGLGTGTAGADGSTTEVANLTTALSYALGSVFYYTVTTNSTSGALAALATHLTAKALPKSGMRQVLIAGYTGSLATGITLATGVNYERIAIGWQYNSEHDAAELAGYTAAARVWGETVKLHFNFDGFRRPDVWGVQAAYSTADWPTTDDQNDAINGGLTPIASDAAGSFMVMSITTRSKNAAGTVSDFRAAETHRVSVLDSFTGTLLARMANDFGNQALRPDTYLADGVTVNPNQVLPKGVVTPSRMIPTIGAVIDDFDAIGSIKNADVAKNALQVIKSAVNSGRIEAGIDLEATDLVHQGTFRIAEVSAG